MDGNIFSQERNLVYWGSKQRHFFDRILKGITHHTMGYAFFICSCDQFLSNLEWLHILIFFSSLFVGVGIGFALLAHPFRGSFARNHQPPSVFAFFFQLGRDWHRFARPSLLGYPLQEIINHLSAVIFILFYMSTGKQVSRILISCG